MRIYSLWLPTATAPRPGRAARNHQNKPPQHLLVAGAGQCGLIFQWPKIGLDSAALALDRSLLDLELGENRRRDRALVGEVVASCLAPFIIRSA
jgi:hypothetical protein